MKKQYIYILVGVVVLYFLYTKAQAQAVAQQQAALAANQQPSTLSLIFGGASAASSLVSSFGAGDDYDNF